MKKVMWVMLAVLMVANVAFAAKEAYAPVPPRFSNDKASDNWTYQNAYLATSGDRGVSVNAAVALTDFKYDLDGKWVLWTPSQIAVYNNNPVMTFTGGNDINGYSHVWFWSQATGAVVVDSTIVGCFWPSISVSDAGDIYAVWGDYYIGAYGSWENMAGDIYASRSTDGGSTWGAKVNVSAYIEALNPSDVLQTCPRVAKISKTGLHLIYADDSKAPGSYIQGIGALDTLFIRYLKVDLDLGGIDAGIGVQTFGITSYDFIPTGCTQGIAINSAEEAIGVWTKGKFPYGSGTRTVGWNAWVGGALAGENSFNNGIGFPGVDVCADHGAGELPAVTWHGGGVMHYTVDEMGVGQGLWTTTVDVPDNGGSHIWPSIAYVGGANSGDSVMCVGRQSTLYNQAAARFTPNNGANWNHNYIPNNTTQYDGIGYVAVGANPNGPEMWVAYEGDTIVTVYRPPVAPVCSLTVNSPDITVWWLRSSTDATADSFFVYSKIGAAGSWTEDTALAATAADTMLWNHTFNLPHAQTDSIYYGVYAQDPIGRSDMSNVVWVIVNGAVVNGVEGGRPNNAASIFTLKQNYPNPVSGNTAINFNLPKAGDYSLNIYNVAGQLVKSYRGVGNAGSNSVSWNTKNVSNGVYVYKLVSGKNSATKKLVVLK
jgi:hypothetical protein